MPTTFPDMLCLQNLIGEKGRDPNARTPGWVQNGNGVIFPGRVSRLLASLFRVEWCTLLSALSSPRPLLNYFCRGVLERCSHPLSAYPHILATPGILVCKIAREHVWGYLVRVCARAHALSHPQEPPHHPFYPTHPKSVHCVLFLRAVEP